MMSVVVANKGSWDGISDQCWNHGIMVVAPMITANSLLVACTSPKMRHLSAVVVRLAAVSATTKV